MAASIDLVHPGRSAEPAREFVGLEHIDQFTGVRLGSRPLGDESGRKFRFAPGDVLYGYLRPYQNKVWLADRFGLCSVEQFVLRVRGGGTAAGPYLAHALRAQSVLSRVIDATNGLQLPRLSAGKLLNMEIPWPSEVGFNRLLDELNSLQIAGSETLRLMKRQGALATEIWSSSLDEAFTTDR